MVKKAFRDMNKSIETVYIKPMLNYLSSRNSTTKFIPKREK